jgi:hypothetical protein
MMNHTPCLAHTRSQLKSIDQLGFTVSSSMGSTYLILNEEVVYFCLPVSVFHLQNSNGPL